jgi:nicotinate (nicotinamide) nucleotide adenylyltransferase
MAGQAPDAKPALRWIRPRREAERVAAPRLGVLSSLFNPPTRAHLALAAAALRQLSINDVVFLLPVVPPHKKEVAATLEQRAEMLRLALCDIPECSAAICTHGLFLEMARALRECCPEGTQFTFLMGRDAAQRILVEWPYTDREAALAEMFSLFSVAVADRDGSFHFPEDALGRRYADRIARVTLEAEFAEHSSTRARAAAARGEALEKLVPSLVAEYIRAHGLYAAGGAGN